MVLRWTAAGVLEAERGFNRVAGYRGIPLLSTALRARDAQLDHVTVAVDLTEKAA